MWQLNGELASFKTAAFQFRLNAERPIEGLQSIRCGDFDLEICPLQISAQPALKDQAEPVEEVFVRGDDLIATYQLAAERTARPQIVWTAADDDQTLTLDVTVAMQTPLLDSDPSLTSVTMAPADEVLFGVGSIDDCEFQDAAQAPRQANGLFLFRLPGCDYSYAEMVYPADFDAGQMEYADGRLEYRLLHEFLEKGVIRKVQLRAMLVPRDRDLELAKAGFAALKTAAPPLTT